jgi:hypothetical protein
MLGTIKTMELGLVGWGGEAMTKTDPMEGIGDSKAMTVVGMIGSESNIRIKTLVYMLLYYHNRTPIKSRPFAE